MRYCDDVALFGLLVIHLIKRNYFQHKMEMKMEMQKKIERQLIH